MRALCGCSSSSLSGSLKVLGRKEFTSSAEQTKLTLRLSPRSFLVKVKGLEMKAVRFLALFLSFPVPLCSTEFFFDSYSLFYFLH